MNDLNSSLIQGYIVDEPVQQTNFRGIPVSTFTIATKKEKQISHVDIQALGKLAGTCMGRKGRKVKIIGELEQDRLIDRDGNEKLLPRLYIVAAHIEFI